MAFDADEIGSHADIMARARPLRDPLRVLRRLILLFALLFAALAAFSSTLEFGIHQIPVIKYLELSRREVKRDMEIISSGKIVFDEHKEVLPEHIKRVTPTGHDSIPPVPEIKWIPGQSSIPPVTDEERAAAQTVTFVDVIKYVASADFLQLFAGRLFFLCLFGLPALYIVFRILPARATNALYLRSFQNDAATLGIRKTLQRALGYRQFRLSGIRDPRRRGSAIWRGLNLFLLAIRYSTPKYMDLEAGDDWKARLWRSFADAQCAFIDLSNPTPFLTEEAVLAMRCLGPKRVLFIGSDTEDEQTWRHRVVELLGWEYAAEEVQIAVWGTERAKRVAFAERVRRFAADLPDGTAGLCSDAVPLIRSSYDLRAGHAEEWKFWTMILVGMLIPLLWGILVTAVQLIHPSTAMALTMVVVALVPTSINAIAFVVTFGLYIYERGFD